MCAEHRSFLDGVELADSFDFNPHKWLLTSFDCSAMWVRDRSAIIDALSITPPYLRSKEYVLPLVPAPPSPNCFSAGTTKVWCRTIETGRCRLADASAA